METPISYTVDFALQLAMTEPPDLYQGALDARHRARRACCRSITCDFPGDVKIAIEAMAIMK